ncbi:hypothetical protein P3L10_013824 [Capsicum annuum]|uniref:uncharacterized protein LOC124898123 n=1 Tax=Capsicum annuum TaxID=4072 RepID=UPI001FB09773|nr:uncharacterized protein LOC124898123 [Capsicum annuum]XP_047267715.1 uncharacterized protein LOC124898123 [Capsicum annuum]
MGSQGNSWADQWGSQNDVVEEDFGKKGKSSGKKMEKVLAVASASFGKAKSAAAVGADKAKAAVVVGAKKVKSGTSSGFNWIKDKCQKK